MPSLGSVVQARNNSTTAGAAGRRRARLTRLCGVLWLLLLDSTPRWWGVKAEENQLFDGTEIDDKDFLWFTAIRRATDFRYVCSGALVGPRYVLTARHCVDALSLSNTRVQVGYLCDDQSNCGRPHITIAISKWDLDRNGGDFALLTLESNVPFAITPAVPFIGQAKQGDLSTGRELTLVGAGRVGANLEISFKVEQIEVKVLSEKKCLKKIRKPDFVTEFVVCSVPKAGNTCQGDSGAPLVVRGKKSLKKRDVIMAIHSFGPAACSDEAAKGRPLGHFRLEEASKMIRRVICQGPFPADWCDLKKNTNKNNDNQNVPFLEPEAPTSAPKNKNNNNRKPAEPLQIFFKEALIYNSAYLNPTTNTTVTINNKKGTSITIDRNAWYAFLLDEPQDITGDFVLKFDFTVDVRARRHFVCLDVDLNFATNSELCFHLAGTDSFSTSWNRYALFPEPLDGQTVSYTIPLSHYIGDTTRFTRYIAFVNYHTSSIGRSTYSNVYLYRDPSVAGRQVTVQVKKKDVSATPIRYGGTNDATGTTPRLVIPNNGQSLTINGNAWNAIPIGLYELNKDTVLEFDFRVNVLGSNHFICLDVDLNFVYSYGTDNPDICFRVAGTEAFSRFWTRYGLFPEPFLGQQVSHVVPLYQHLENVSPTIRYISLVTSGDAALGEATFSNIKLRDLPDAYPGELKLDILGTNLDATPVRYGGSNDFAGVGERLQVTRKGRALTVKGNSWTAYSIGLISLTPQMVLEFDFVINSLSRKHFVCLDIDLTFSTGSSSSTPSSETCFLLAGTDAYSVSFTRHALYPQPLLSQQVTYSIPLSQFIGNAAKTVRYITFVTSGTPDAGEVTFSNVKLYTDSSLDEALSIEVMGTAMEIQPSRYAERYDIFGVSPRFQVSNNQKEVTLFGNSWNAYDLGSLVELTADSVLEFDFIATFLGGRHLFCLDIDLTYGYNRYAVNPEMCFHLTGTAAYDVEWTPFNIVPNPIVAQKVSYEVPLAHFISGTPRFVRYLVLATSSSESTGGDQGQATFSNLRFRNGRRHRGGLVMDIMGIQPAPLPVPVRYGGAFDAVGPAPKFSVSSDGEELTLHGNSWNAYPIGLTQLTGDTVLEFDFVVNFVVGGLHFVCLDLDNAYEWKSSTVNPDLCFRLAGTNAYSNGWTRHGIYPEPLLSQKVSYAIPLGQYIDNIPGRSVRYLTFVTSGPEPLVQATFSNIKLLQSAPKKHLGEMTFDIFGSDVTSSPVRYAGVFDFYGTWPRYEALNKGNALTLFGNVWSAYPVDVPTVTASTVLEFDFVVDFVSDRHLICLDQDASYSYRRFTTNSEWCFHVAGTTWDDEWTRFGPLAPTPLLSQKVTFRLVLGDYVDFTTENISVNYIVFATRGAADVGQVTFSNVKLSSS